MLEIGYFVVLFEKLGVKVVYASQPNLKTETAIDTLLLMLEAFKAEGSNEERQRKSISGQTKALMEGRYTFSPKPGYMRGTERGVQLVHPKRGPALQRVLKRLAVGLVTPTQALMELNKSEFMENHGPYKMDKFSKIACDPFYAGVVEINKQVKVRNEKGLHERLIELEEHYQILDRMKKRPKYQSGPNRQGNPEFPLNNILIHDNCLGQKNGGRVVGYNHSNGKNSQLVYKKYRCRTCNKYWKQLEVHESTIGLLDKYEITNLTKTRYMKALDIVWQQNQKQSEEDISRLRNSLLSIKSSIKQKVEDATNPDFASIREDILSSIETKKQKVKEIESEIYNLTKAEETSYKEFISFALSFIRDNSNHFLEDYVSKENRVRCKQLVFSGEIMINKSGKVYTPQYSHIYRLAAKKKGAAAPEVSHLVRVRGL